MAFLPYVTLAELDEEIAQIQAELDRMQFVKAVSPEAEANRVENVAGLIEWKADLLMQREQMTREDPAPRSRDAGENALRHDLAAMAQHDLQRGLKW